MLSLVFAEVVLNFKRVWTIYLKNTISILFIILMFAYIDGAQRLLNLHKTAFLGDVVVKVNEGNGDPMKILASGIGDVEFISKKIRCDAKYQLPASDNSGQVEFLGVDFPRDPKLAKYLTIREGAIPATPTDILVPTSILQWTDLALGDIVLMHGKNADGVYNAAPFKVSGFYNSAGLGIFERPRFLVTYEAMNGFYMPRADDIEYCVFFREGKIPPTINKNIRAVFNDEDREKVKSIEAISVSAFDVLNISVQMNVFFVLLITLTIIVLVSIVMLVNFNMYIMVFRQRQKQLGTFLAFGVRPWKLAASLFLESLFQIGISTGLALLLAELVSFAAHKQIVGGSMKVILILLSGTNQLDFFVRLPQVLTTFMIIFPAVILAQIPMYAKIFFSNPINMLTER